jgi:4,5-dihydroxyphthalate decarboxylase
MTQSDSKPVKLKALLGDYPNTAALKEGRLKSSLASFDFAPEKVAHEAFKRFVRDLEFDLGELALMTFLLARDKGLPLVLAPAVIVGRFQHDALGYNPEHGKLTVKNLNGKRLGVRSYTVTTCTWVRGILQNDYGVDLDSITNVSFEDPHVPYEEPGNVVRASGDKTLKQMIIDGEVDAGVITGADIRKEPKLASVFEDPEKEAAAWYARHKIVPINHLLVVRQDFSRERPDVVKDVFGLLKAARQEVPAGQIDMLPFGLENMRSALELGIQYAYQQKLISRRFEVDELFDDATRGLK